MSDMCLIEKLLEDTKVEWKTLGDVVNIKKGKDWQKLGTGNIPVYGSGGVIGHVDTYVYNKPTVLIPRKGSITNIFYVEEPFWNINTIYYTKIDISQITPKFFYYFMKTIDLMCLNTGSGIPSLTKDVLNKIKIPIPSLKEQSRIVAILDKFDALTHSLSECLHREIELRQKQYEYYRNKLLNFFDDVDVEWKPLGDLANLRRGRVMSKEYFVDNAGSYPVYSSQTLNNGVIGRIHTFDFDGEFISWTTDGANSGTVFYRTGKFSITNVCGIITINDDSRLKYKFLYYWLSVVSQKYVYSGRGSPKLMIHHVEKIPIPIPCPNDVKKSLEIQSEIVRILDQFDALTDTLTDALTDELTARKKQYEYYRNKLLTFSEQKRKEN
jgi:type I restriction enzyme S subunit